MNDSSAVQYPASAKDVEQTALGEDDEALLSFGLHQITERVVKESGTFTASPDHHYTAANIIPSSTLSHQRRVIFAETANQEQTSEGSAAAGQWRAMQAGLCRLTGACTIATIILVS
jgi:hypothetical protein